MFLKVKPRKRNIVKGLKKKKKIPAHVVPESGVMSDDRFFSHHVEKLFSFEILWFSVTLKSLPPRACLYNHL